MSTDTPRYVRLDQARELAPHIFTSESSARYCRANADRLGMDRVFKMQLGKVIVDLREAQAVFDAA